MSLVLSGNSGSLTVDSSAGITFPSGSNPQAAPSKVLQVVQATNNTQVTTSSGSYVAQGLSLSITPLFSTSKILLFWSGDTFINTAGTNPFVGIGRNGTVVYQSLMCYGGSSTTGAAGSLIYLDSPATTSATTYAIYIKITGGSGTMYINQDAVSQYSLTAMEIAQ